MLRVTRYIPNAVASFGDAVVMNAGDLRSIPAGVACDVAMFFYFKILV